MKHTSAYPAFCAPAWQEKLFLHSQIFSEFSTLASSPKSNRQGRNRATMILISKMPTRRDLKIKDTLKVYLRIDFVGQSNWRQYICVWRFQLKFIERGITFSLGQNIFKLASVVHVGKDHIVKYLYFRILEDSFMFLIKYTKKKQKPSQHLLIWQNKLSWRRPTMIIESSSSISFKFSSKKK